MEETVVFLIRHGYVVLFVWVLIDQIGLPLPVMPLLLATGALSGTGQLSFFPAVLLASSASFISHIPWYEMGRYRGGAVLGLLCKISFEPDACVRRTENTYARFGKSSLLISKFVPGLNTVAAPVAGMFKMPRAIFLLLNALGSVLWSGTFIGLGYVFRDQLEDVLEAALSLGSWLGVFLGIVLVGYIAYKYLRRHQVIRSLRVARITPEELKQKLDTNEDVVLVDLRHVLDVANAPDTLPNAIRMTPEELPLRHHEIPVHRDIILFCT